MKKFDMGACHREAQRRLFGYAWKTKDDSAEYDEDVVQQIVEFHQNASHEDLVLNIKRLVREDEAKQTPHCMRNQEEW